MRKYKHWLVMASVMAGLSGCSTLSSTQTDFTDVVNEVKEKGSYVEVEGKTIHPSVKSMKGIELVNSELSYTAIIPKSNATVSATSNVQLDVSYLKNYESFVSISVNGEKPQKIKNLLPISETCAEFCTQHQVLSVPLSNQQLNAINSKDVTFDLYADSRNHARLAVPKGYFEAILSQSNQINRVHDLKAAPTAQALQTKAVEMLEYWYGKASKTEQEAFVKFAFDNRKGEVATLASESQTVKMMHYWFSEGSSDERKQMLTWLIAQ